PIGTGVPVALPRDDAIQVRQIGFGEHNLWARVVADGWADVVPELHEFLLGLGQVNPHRVHTYCFLAEKDGEAAAAGAICLFEKVALLAGACTIPKWRRQGAQLALLGDRLRFAAENGCEIAMVVAAPGSASQHNAERRGFRVAYTRTKWCLGRKRP